MDNVVPSKVKRYRDAKGVMRDLPANPVDKYGKPIKYHSPAPPVSAPSFNNSKDRTGARHLDDLFNHTTGKSETKKGKKP